MNQKSKSTKKSFRCLPSSKLFDDFTEDDETYLDDTIQELYFGDRVEQLDSDNY